MPLIWDRHGRYGREDDHRIATENRPVAGPGSIVELGGATVGGTHHSGHVHDKTQPPKRRKVLLDNGRGESTACRQHNPIENLPHVATPLDRDRKLPGSTNPESGERYQRSRAAGKPTPPPSPEDTSTVEIHSKVTHRYHSAFLTLVPRPEYDSHSYFLLRCCHNSTLPR